LASRHLDEIIERVREIGVDGTIVILAGPGAAAGGSKSADRLRQLARAGGLGVLNTWGAKGLFEWQDPHHLGTAGLQADDFVLAGLGDADLIIATGIDPHEAPADRWQLAPHVSVAPRELAALAEAWPLAPGVPARPPLYTRLAEVVQPLFASDRVPLSPARAVADLKAALPPGGTVFAGADLAGFWIARTFPTSDLGSVSVPAQREPGSAAWAAVNAASSGRAAIAVTTAPYDLETDDALAFAAASGIAFVLVVWGEGNVDRAADHGADLREAVASGRVRVVEVPIDWSDTDLLITVAGPIIAWGGRV